MNLLDTRRTTSQQALDAINVIALRLTVETSETELRGFEADNSNSMGLPHIMQEATRHRGAVAHAKQELQSSERDVQRLVRDLAQLDSMIFADARISATEGAIQPARDGVTAARTALDSALGVQREIESLLAVEQNTHEQQNAQAANDLLASVRSGAKPAPFRSNRGMLDALTQAHTQAVADVVHAQATLGAAQAALDATLGERLEAQANASERDLYLSAHSYALALVRHETACAAAAHAYFVAPDVDAMVGDIKREAESVGVPGAPVPEPWGAEARESANFAL